MEKKADIKRQLKQILHNIRLKCREDCCAGDRKSYIDCKITNCTLYNYRLGEVRKKNAKNTKEKQQNFSKNTILEEVVYEKEVENEEKINK